MLDQNLQMLFLMCWNLEISEYRFTMEHKPGANHKDADGVSRLIAAEDGTSNSQQGREDILWLPPTGVAAVTSRPRTSTNSS